MRFHVAARREPLQQRVGGHQPDPAARPGEFRQSGEAGGGNVRMGGEAVIGQRLEIREHPRRQARARKERDLIAEGLGVARVLSNDNEWTRGLGRGFRQAEGRGGSVKPAPFDAGRTCGRKGGIE
jgi:hypothetical protein